jgi:CBS domain-containing protein
MITVLSILRQKGSGVFHCTPDATVLDALREMAARNCGALVVLEGNRPLGVFSERDYARKVVLLGRTSRDTRVRDVSAPVIEVTSDACVYRCMSLMTEHRCRHLIVLDHGELAGVVSIGDVVKAVIDDQQSTIDQLGHYITGV